MTAVNILLQRENAVLFTDTKATNADGLQYNMVKYTLLPWVKMAIAVRGYVGALRVFERVISGNARDYDGAVQFLVEHFDEIRAAEYLDETEAFAMRQDVDVYLVGWGHAGPAAHWISNYRTHGQIQRIDGCHVSPMVDLDAQRRFADDVKQGMPGLMADQAAQNPDVGGWMMVTEIREDHIISYPLGGLCGLSSVGSRQRPQEEVDALADIEARNTDRSARLAAMAAAQ